MPSSFRTNPLLIGLLDTAPREGEGWPDGAKLAWFRALSALVQLVHDTPEHHGPLAIYMGKAQSAVATPTAQDGPSEDELAEAVTTAALAAGADEKFVSIGDIRSNLVKNPIYATQKEHTLRKHIRNAMAQANQAKTGEWIFERAGKTTKSVRYRMRARGETTVRPRNPTPSQ